MQIVKFYPREPWVRFRKDIAPAVDGIRTAALFLIDGETGRGMFGDGTIIVDLYEIGTDQDGYEVSTPVYQWSFDTEQAMPFRSNKRTVQGWGYQLRLQWEDLDLAGREIEVRISFRRLDGQVVNSRGQRFRVPAARIRRRRRPQVAAARDGAAVNAPRARRGPGRLRRPTPTARPKGTPVPATRPAPVVASQPAFVPRTESER